MEFPSILWPRCWSPYPRPGQEISNWLVRYSFSRRLSTYLFLVAPLIELVIHVRQGTFLGIIDLKTGTRLVYYTEVGNKKALVGEREGRKKIQASICFSSYNSNSLFLCPPSIWLFLDVKGKTSVPVTAISVLADFFYLFHENTS